MTIHELLAQGHRTMTRGIWPQGKILYINETGFSYPPDIDATAQDMASNDWVAVEEDGLIMGLRWPYDQPIKKEDNKPIDNIKGMRDNKKIISVYSPHKKEPR